MKSVTLIDIIEAYNFNTDNDLNDPYPIFKDIDIDERLDRDILIASIIDECGGMRCIYDTSWSFKFFSDNFFKKYKWNIGKLLDTLELKYDPLINKKNSWVETTNIEQNLDTDEEKTENRSKINTGTQTTNDTGTQTTNDTGTQTTNDTGTQTNVLDRTVENTVSAMNASTYQPDTNEDTDSTDTRTDDLQSLRTDNLQRERTDNLQSERTDNLTENISNHNTRDKNEDLTWEETDTHEENGTDSDYQSLIEKERKVAQFSIYNWICKKYASELFLLIY